jgi:hypothetical protein
VPVVAGAKRGWRPRQAVVLLGHDERRVPEGTRLLRPFPGSLPNDLARQKTAGQEQGTGTDREY